jgi:hypothetical protein
MKHSPEEPCNPFDSILFWLQLAAMDFTCGSKEDNVHPIIQPAAHDDDTET